jgi:TonB family protein
LHRFDHGLAQIFRKQIHGGIKMKSFASSAHDANSISGLGVFTLVLWFGCLLIGGLGFALPYERPQAPPPKQEAVKVEMLEVKLSNDPEPPPENQTPASEADPLASPQIPQPIAVAQPSPAIAFALPVKGPVRIVEASHAAYTQSSSPAPVAAPALQALTFEQSKQWLPRPDYPERARRDGQEGVVTVRLTVAEDGHVAAVEAVAPTRWFLLNEEALRAARRGHFPPGKPRVYDIPIRFVLK